MPKIQRLAAIFSRASLAGCLLLCLLLLVSDSVSELQGRVSAQSSCPQLNVPATTHGFTTTAGLPNGDHFLLAQPFTLTVPSATPVLGLSSFVVNTANFGGDAAAIGGYASTNLSGISFAAPNGNVTLVSCADSVWDIGFELASAGSTVGDTVTFFVQRPDGTGVINLAVFTHESGGVRVTSLHPNVRLFRNDRLATQGRIQAGELIPLNVAAGAAGNRSSLLVLAFDPAAGSPLNDCFQFGTTLTRGSNVGASALVFTDFVVKRMEQAGDRALTGTGLLGGLAGGYPTSLVCQVNCPTCQVVQSPCPTITSLPALTHGFFTNASFPQGDHFLLPQPFTLTVPQTGPVTGFNTFPVNTTNFGGNAAAIGGFAGTNLTGFSYSTPGGSVTALSCADSLWDIGFELASTGMTEGDIIRFFLQNPNGSGLQALAVFTYETGGVRVTSLNPNLSLFRENRLANGPGQIFAGELIPFSTAAGTAGNRTPLLILAFAMRADSPLNGCFQFGTSITRGSGVGTSSIVFTDFIVKRMEQAGDRNLTGTGLLGGLTGGFPTGLVCQEACPVCPVQTPISCPSNQTVCPPTGSTTATVNYTTPTGATCTPASGSSFPVGTTTVNCTANSGGTPTSCSFTVTVTPNVTLTCPTNITTTATGASGTTVTFSLPTVTPTGTAVTCTPASGTTFPVGVTTVTCTASNTCGARTCTFTVTVGAPPPTKCDTFCWRSPQYWLLNLRRMPQGVVWISGFNGNLAVSTNNHFAIQQALQGSATGFRFTAQQRFNQEYVAAQLNLILAGGQSSVVNANVLWTNLSCYGINFAPVTLSNGFVLSPGGMVKDLFMQAQLAATQNRAADFAALATLLDLFNGNDLFSCN
jgi:hypothetical protein